MASEPMLSVCWTCWRLPSNNLALQQERHSLFVVDRALGNQYLSNPSAGCLVGTSQQLAHVSTLQVTLMHTSAARSWCLLTKHYGAGTVRTKAPSNASLRSARLLLNGRA